MRPSEGSIGQGEDGDDHEEDEDTDEAGEDVVVPVRVIPGEGRVGQGQHTDEQQADCVRLVEKLWVNKNLNSPSGYFESIHY